MSAVLVPTEAPARGARTGAAAHRLRELRGAALADSAGLAFGWTVFILFATRTNGVASAAIYQAAACVGSAAAAPASRWLSARLAPRSLIRALAVVEAALRVAALLMLVAGAPRGAVVPVVLVMNTVAWSGYAAMRAEVAVLGEGAHNLTRYALTVAATEALAAAAAGCLPFTAGTPGRPELAVIAVLYAGALAPTWLAAGAARRRVHRVDVGARRQRGILVGGGLVTLLAAGPALLAVPLAATWYGSAGVVVAALAFTAGSLAAPTVAGVLERTGRSPRLVWPALGAVALFGWAGAQLCLPLLAVAQICAGLGQVALEGAMDGRAVAGAPPSQHTGVLAGTAAIRSLAGAVAVGVLPFVTARISLTGYAAVAGAALCLAAAAGSAGPRPFGRASRA